ncbi:MAG: phosphoglucomutase [Desulfurococcaceae archaeon]
MSPVKLFGTAGIRMKYPSELGPLLAYRIGLAVASLELSGRAVLVKDSRLSSDVLSLALAAGMAAGGCDVLMAGLAPTPVAGYAAEKLRAIGVSVTASHNPPEYNGFKFYDPEGFEFVRDLEERVEALVEGQLRERQWNEAGRLGMVDVLEDYIDDLVEFVGSPRQKHSPTIVVDLANGSGAVATPAVLARLGARPVTVNGNVDGTFPGRPPEPRKDVLEGLMDVYSSLAPLAIFSHDGDADRLAVLDPVDGFVRQDRLIALLADAVLARRRGEVVVSIDTGKVVDLVAERHGARVTRYKLGKTHELVKSLGRGAVAMAAEPWKFIDTAWGPWVDGVLQAAVVAKILVEEGRRLSKILEERGIPDYPWDRRSYSFDPPDVRGAVYEALIEELKGALGEPAEVTEIDGTRYDYDDGSWILVRLSGTEPKLRIYAEAMDRERLSSIVSIVENIVRAAANRAGGRIAEVTVG